MYHTYWYDFSIMSNVTGWLLLYRLAYGIPLVMDDSLQTALAYREALIRFYFKHKISEIECVH